VKEEYNNKMNDPAVCCIMGNYDYKGGLNRNRRLPKLIRHLIPIVKQGEGLIISRVPCLVLPPLIVSWPIAITLPHLYNQSVKMGADGGSIPDRSDMVKTKARSKVTDKDILREIFFLCALSKVCPL